MDGLLSSVQCVPWSVSGQVAGVMLPVAVAATIASVQSIVDSMTTFKFFD